jgi:hypothetical protein
MVRRPPPIRKLRFITRAPRPSPSVSSLLWLGAHKGTGARPVLPAIRCRAPALPSQQPRLPVTAYDPAVSLLRTPSAEQHRPLPTRTSEYRPTSAKHQPAPSTNHQPAPSTNQRQAPTSAKHQPAPSTKFTGLTPLHVVATVPEQLSAVECPLKPKIRVRIRTAFFALRSSPPSSTRSNRKSVFEFEQRFSPCAAHRRRVPSCTEK